MILKIYEKKEDVAIVLEKEDGKHEILNFLQSDNPNENTLELNFNDCYRIKELIEIAYKCGKNGEDFKIEKLN